MNCKTFRNRITDLVIFRDQHDVAELLNHAANCSECSSELEAARDLIRAITPSHQLVASPRLKENIMKHVYELEANTTSAARPTVSRSRTRRNAWAYGAGAAILTAVIVCFTLLSSPNLAFSQVVEQLAKARALIYRSTITDADGATRNVIYQVHQSGKSRIDSDGASSMIFDPISKQAISLNHEKKTYILMDTSSLPSGKPGSQVNFVERMQNLQASTAIPGDSRKKDRRVLQSFKAKDEHAEYLIWADSVSGEIEYVDFEMSDMPGTKGQVLDFQYLHSLDENLFSMVPPAGYTTSLPANTKAVPPTEEDFVSFLETYALSSAGNVFPETLDPLRFMKDLTGIEDLKKKGPAVFKEEMRKRLSGTIFPKIMTEENDFHYAGAGKMLGNADDPVAWYKPTGATDYRVIYADLTVREVPANKLPQE